MEKSQNVCTLIGMLTSNPWDKEKKSTYIKICVNAAKEKLSVKVIAKTSDTREEEKFKRLIQVFLKKLERKH